MVAWNASIPTGPELLSTTQPQLLQNNQSIDSVFNDGTNGNFTKYVLQNVGTIGASISDPVSVLHAVNGSGTVFNGHPLPFFKNSIGDLPILPDIVNTTSSGLNNYSFKIGNLIVNYGQVSGTSSPFTITFPAPYTYTSTSTYSVVATNSQRLNAFLIENTSTSVATITGGGANTSFNYIAIGY